MDTFSAFLEATLADPLTVFFSSEIALSSSVSSFSRSSFSWTLARRFSSASFCFFPSFFPDSQVASTFSAILASTLSKSDCFFAAFLKGS
jgi:hypothetical protein